MTISITIDNFYMRLIVDKAPCFNINTIPSVMTCRSAQVRSAQRSSTWNRLSWSPSHSLVPTRFFSHFTDTLCCFLIYCVPMRNSLRRQLINGNSWVDLHGKYAQAFSRQRAVLFFLNFLGNNIYMTCTPIHVEWTLSYCWINAHKECA